MTAVTHVEGNEEQGCVQRQPSVPLPLLFVSSPSTLDARAAVFLSTPPESKTTFGEALLRKLRARMFERWHKRRPRLRQRNLWVIRGSRASCFLKARLKSSSRESWGQFVCDITVLSAHIWEPSCIFKQSCYAAFLNNKGFKGFSC